MGLIKEEVRKLTKQYGFSVSLSWSVLQDDGEIEEFGLVSFPEMEDATQSVDKLKQHMLITLINRKFLPDPEGKYLKTIDEISDFISKQRHTTYLIGEVIDAED